MKRKHFFRLANILVILALIITTGEVGLFPHSAGAVTFTENFSTTTYKDNANTTADWNTGLGKLRLPQLGWTKADGSPGYDNISFNRGCSTEPQIVLDSSSRPNIVWVDDTTGNYEIFFSKWNGIIWTKADGSPGYDNISNNSGWSIDPRIVLDSSGRPNIGWSEGFSKWNSTTWTKADGLTPGYDNINAQQFVLDSSGRPNIVWDDETTGNYDILFSKWNGSAWTKADGTTTPNFDNISNNSSISGQPKIVLDANQRPNIVWRDYITPPNYEILFSKWNCTTWTKTDGTTTPNYDNISNNSGGAWYPQIVLDSSQRPNVVWYDDTPGNIDVFFSKWNGTTWTGLATSGYDNVSNNFGTIIDVIYVGPQIALDSSGRPNIVWYDNTPGNYDIFFSLWNGAKWTKADGSTPGCDNVSNNNCESLAPQIILDSSQRPNIVWMDNTPKGKPYDYSILFSKWNGFSWTKADGLTHGYDNISRNNFNCAYPKIVLDVNQRPNIVWDDGTPGNRDIFFSKYKSGGGFLNNASAQSLKINTGTQNITKATLTVSQNLNGQTINYYLSANGGLRWESITSGVEHTFIYQGNDLRWKAILSSTNPSVTPEIDSLSINYTIEGRDTTSPTGTVTINSGAIYTHSRNVMLSFAATDNVRVSDLIVSESSSFTGVSWTSYVSTRGYTLSSGDGEKIVYAKFRDTSGLISNITSDSIKLVTQKSIKRLEGETRYETAVAISKEGFPQGANYIILARGDLFPDALSGSPLAAKYNVPILLTNPRFLTSSTQKEIGRLKAKEVFILGTEDAVSEGVVSDLEEKCSIEAAKIHRYGGETRYETASLIAQQLSSPSNKTAFVATGENYPDALASASIGAANGMPILLVRGDIALVPDPIKDALKKLGIEKTVITGGTDVVPSSIENWLKDNGYSPTRLGGATRYDTCKLIADEGIKSYSMYANSIAIAVGENFPDALTLGPYAGAKKAPLLLVREFLPNATKNFVETNKNDIYELLIAGGADVVSDKVVEEIWGMIK